MPHKKLPQKIALGAWLIGLMSGQAHASTNIPALTPREINLGYARQLDAQRQKELGSNTGFLVRPGLLADKTGRVVRISAESIHLNPGTPVEFPLITLDSGKDYEALAVSFASAFDIREALTFIGLTPGYGVDSTKLRFWPKGDRVGMSFCYQADGTNGPSCTRRAEQLVWDTRTSKTLPETGFIFTGSEWLPSVEPATGKVFAADAFTPGSIASLYNEAFTVLDVPRKAEQSVVYEHQIPNPDYLLPSNHLIEITLEPFYADNRSHRVDLSLTVGPASNTLSYLLKDASATTVNTNTTWTGFLAALEGFFSAGMDCYLTVNIDDAVPLSSLQKAAQLLNTLDVDQGIRIEAPPEGQPYYKAFLPSDRFRARENRPASSAELHLTSLSSNTTGRLIWVEAEWIGNDDKATYKETPVSIDSAQHFERALAARPELPPAMLIFAPPDIPYGTLRQFTAPLVKRNMILYVFSRK